MNEVDINHVPPIVGEGPKRQFESIYACMKYVRKPLLFTGPAGSGKSVSLLFLRNSSRDVHIRDDDADQMR
jgi:hypothetical protein